MTIIGEPLNPIIAIARQTERIQFNDKGVAWIENYIKPPGDEAKWVAAAKLHMPMDAMSLPGNKEAEALLNAALREYLPDIINLALHNAQKGNREAVADIKRIGAEL